MAKTQHHNPGAPPPPEQEHLPCPRCDSTNTKFCYYNNYNFSQPRHFCKSCRRYWTHGGTLRDIPVGGGTRKNAKRSRTTSATSTPSAVIGPIAAAAAASDGISSAGTPMLVPLTAKHGASLQYGCGGAAGDGKANFFWAIGGPLGLGLDGKGNGAGGAALCGSFTSLLNTQGPGLSGLGGFGPGFEEMGFGLGRGIWPFQGVEEGGAGLGGGNGGGGNGVSGSAGAVGMGNNPWQFESAENGFVGGDCFPWPDLAISTPGNGLK